MICDGVELERLIDRYVNGRNAERNREILKAYYLGGATSYEQVAETCDVSPSTVYRVVHQCGDPIILKLHKN